MTWERVLLLKFPVFNPAWPTEIQDQWFALFWRLRAAQAGAPR